MRDKKSQVKQQRLQSGEGAREGSSRRVRLQAGKHPRVGDQRYALFRCSADRAAQALKDGYYLEAITLIESMLAERLEKRAQYFWESKPSQRDALEKSRVQNGFATLGKLVDALKATEHIGDIRNDVLAVERWAKGRNVALHGMAKFGKGSDKTWKDRYKKARDTVKEGIEVLKNLDLHDRRDSHANRKRRYASATCPDALSSLCQPTCEWCKEDSAG
jgi:hypothetical protein